MKFSLRLNNDLPVQEYVKIAHLAEMGGFDQIWVSNDLFLRSATVILTAVASVTERIQIGTCILNPYTINPAEIAMFAATLDEYSGERFNLGIAAGASDFLEWIGIDHDRPRTSLVESINVINQLLSGETATYSGHFINWSREAYLRFKPLRRVPIYIGAMSPNMLRSIGEVADGGLPLLFPPEHYRNVIPYINEGALNAGRQIDEIDVAACIWCSLSDDGEAARDALREKVAYYGHAMSTLILDQLGLTHHDFAEVERVVMVEKNIEKAKSLVTDEMLRIGIAGDTRDLIKRLEDLAGMGVKHMSFGPPLGPDPVKAVEQIGREVIPYFSHESSF